jgi:hypothetical protein
VSSGYSSGAIGDRRARHRIEKDLALTLLDAVFRHLDRELAAFARAADRKSLAAQRDVADFRAGHRHGVNASAIIDVVGNARYVPERLETALRADEDDVLGSGTLEQSSNARRDSLDTSVHRALLKLIVAQPLVEEEQVLVRKFDVHSGLPSRAA